MGLYTYDYFCGANCSVYIGDTWVDDLVYLSYEANSSKIPVYGYASTHWDAMLPGRVLIQGTFGIAFKETILIPAIIRSFRYDQLPQEDFDVRTPLTDGQKIKDLEAENIRSGKYRTSLYNYLNSLSVKDFKSETKNLEQKLFGSAYNLDAISELESLEYYKDGFNIFISLKTENSQTSKQILNVHIVGESMAHDTSGDPIGQIFNFFARQVL